MTFFSSRSHSCDYLFATKFSFPYFHSSASSSYEPTVNEVNVPILDRDLCNEWLVHLNVTDGMVCMYQHICYVITYSNDLCIQRVHIFVFLCVYVNNGIHFVSIYECGNDQNVLSLCVFVCLNKSISSMCLCDQIFGNTQIFHWFFFDNRNDFSISDLCWL